MNGDGAIVGALSAEPGMKQTCYIAQPAYTVALRGRDGGPDGVGVQVGLAYTPEARAEVQCVAFQERGRSEGRTLELGGDLAYALTAPSGGGRAHERNILDGNMQVRRLIPVECERLQGFPDGHTDIAYRDKPATDGHRYKALGNSMAVSCMGWLGRRIIMGLEKPWGYRL